MSASRASAARGVAGPGLRPRLRCTVASSSRKDPKRTGPLPAPVGQGGDRFRSSRRARRHRPGAGVCAPRSDPVAWVCLPPLRPRHMGLAPPAQTLSPGSDPPARTLSPGSDTPPSSDPVTVL